MPASPPPRSHDGNSPDPPAPRPASTPPVVRSSHVWRHAGNRDLWTAARVSADALARGLPLHLHAEGPRGTGKTTVLRAFARALPLMTRVRGCPYNCDPEAPHCPHHRGLSPAELRAVGAETVPRPFLELSASAKLATAVGTVDLARLLDPARPEAALLPGTIARAHRGILFVDEINRLADVAPELTDALLDVMGQKPGRLQIEEAGLPPVVLSVVVTVWAASNPDEEPGPLEHTRLQLADRFDLRIRVEPPADAAVVLAMLRSAGGGAPTAAPAFAGEDDGERNPFEPPPCGGTGDPAFPDGLLRDVATFYVRAGLGSLRALQAWRWAAEGLARLARRREVRAEDVRAAARLALRGRIDPEALESALRGWAEAGEAEDAAPVDGAHAVASEGEEDGEAGGARRAARPIGEVRPLVRPEWRGGNP